MADFWFVFRLAPGKERAAETRLGSRGFLPFVPVWKRLVRPPSRGRGVPVARLVPVIPGYVFVFLPLSWKAIRAVLETEFPNGKACVSDVLRFNGEPGKISEGVMQEFMQVVAKGPNAATGETAEVGNHVRVKIGPFADMTGTLTFHRGARAKIVDDLFKRTIELPYSNLELAAQPENNNTSGRKVLRKDANHRTTFRRDQGRQAGRGAV